MFAGPNDSPVATPATGNANLVPLLADVADDGEDATLFAREDAIEAA
jgi:hypothetical protein